MLAKHCLEEFKLDCQLRRLTDRTINGYDIVLVQRLLQHSSAATQRYIGIEPQRIEQAIKNHSVLI